MGNYMYLIQAFFVYSWLFEVLYRHFTFFLFAIFFSYALILNISANLTLIIWLLNLSCLGLHQVSFCSHY